MPSCVAYNCVNRSGSDVTLHSFPHNDRKRLRQWVKNINREAWKPSPHSRLCEQHFTPDCYTINGKKLKPNAVPTIFDFSDPVTLSGPSTAKCADINDISFDHDYCIGLSEVAVHEVRKNPPEATASNFADHHYAVMSTPSLLEQQVVKKLQTCRKKLKMEKQRSRKLEQKISRLTQVITSLIEKEGSVKVVLRQN